MTYEERNSLRGSTLESVFQATQVIEDYVRANWQQNNYIPNNEEIKYACEQSCILTKEKAKKGFAGNKDLYKRYCKECNEIKERFQKLNAKTPAEAACSVYQVNHYLYEETYDLLGESLGLPSISSYDYEY